MKKRQDFDAFGDSYDEMLEEAIAFSGDDVEYYDRYKASCLSRWVIGDRRNLNVLDLGCGVGRLTALVARAHPDCTVHGWDISDEMTRVARSRHTGIPNLRFFHEPPRETEYDVVFAANVFHHIPPQERLGTLEQARSILSSSGKLVIFEHNPWNPLTRYVVRTCPFDVDAQLITSRKFARLARSAGFEVETRRYIVFFPRLLKMFRRFESILGGCPAGAQYMMVLKPSTDCI